MGGRIVKIRDFSFSEELLASEGTATCANVSSVLLSNISGSLSVSKAHSVNDKSGTDWWVECCNGRHLSIDAKVRKNDFLKLYGHDDLALETWSVIERKKVGWTLDESKRADFILWLWTDTSRWCMVPFPMLCKVFQEQLTIWMSRYKVAKQHTKDKGNYHSECVFVPRREVWRAIYDRYSGMSPSMTKQAIVSTSLATVDECVTDPKQLEFNW